MPRFSERSERTQDIANTIVRLLHHQGMSGVTMRNVARDVGMSVGTLTGHVTNRERMLAFAARDIGGRRLDGLRLSCRQYGLDGLLPDQPHELLMERAWLAFREWGRELDAVAKAVADVDAQERHLILMALVPGVPEDWRLLYRPGSEALGLGQLPDDAARDAFQATLHGLRDRLCSSDKKLFDLARAQRALAAASALARSSATIVSGSSAE